MGIVESTHPVPVLRLQCPPISHLLAIIRSPFFQEELRYSYAEIKEIEAEMAKTQKNKVSKPSSPEE